MIGADENAVVMSLPPQIRCGALPDPSGLLAAVINHPDEDTPRLMYADWLDEQGDVTVTCAGCDGVPVKATTANSMGDLFGVVNGRLSPVCKACNGTGAVLDRANSMRAELIRVQCENDRQERLVYDGALVGVGPYTSVVTKGVCEVEVRCHNPRDWKPTHDVDVVVDAGDGSKRRLRVRLQEYRQNVYERLMTVRGQLLGSAVAAMPDRTREYELMGAYRKTIALPECDPPMRRGFINEVRCSWGWWAKHGDELRKREWAPLVRLTDMPKHDPGTITLIKDDNGVVTGAVAKIAGVPMQFYHADRGDDRQPRWADVLPQRYPGTAFELPA